MIFHLLPKHFVIDMKLRNFQLFQHQHFPFIFSNPFIYHNTYKFVWKINFDIRSFPLAIFKMGGKLFHFSFLFKHLVVTWKIVLTFIRCSLMEKKGKSYLFLFLRLGIKIIAWKKKLFNIQFILLHALCTLLLSSSNGNRNCLHVKWMHKEEGKERIDIWNWNLIMRNSTTMIEMSSAFSR